MASLSANNISTQLRSKATEAGSFVRTNPLCGISLKRGAQGVAIVHMALFGLIITLFLMVAIFPTIAFDEDEALSQPPDAAKHSHLTLEMVAGIAICVPLFLLYAYLYKGIKEANYTAVARCWIIMATLAVIDVIIIATLIMKKLGPELEAIEFGLGLLPDLFSLYVVYFYKEELNRGADLGDSGDFQRVV